MTGLGAKMRRDAGWRTPLYPLIYNLIGILYGFVCYQLPGLNDAGLAYYRHCVTLYPRVAAGWDTCLSGIVNIRHPQLVKEVLKRSGMFYAWY